MLRGNSDGGKSSLPETEEVATMLDNAGPAVNAIFLGHIPHITWIHNY